MNLEKLFKLQRELDDHIEKKHPRKEGEDRLSKKILALQVELAECAQESRCFKFWSHDQKPRVEEEIPCNVCGGSGRNYTGYCGNCHGGYIGIKNPLLEEYVDCLHFILSIGLEVELPELYGTEIDQDKIVVVVEDVTEQFLIVFEKAKMNTPYTHTAEWFALFEEFYILGKVLGFTWEQIEEAYKSKNRTNHQRQVEGY